MDPITVECDENFDPPMVRVIIPGVYGFMVSWGAYEILHDQYGFPPLICGTYSTED